MKTLLPTRYKDFLKRKLGIIRADPRKIAAAYAVGFVMGVLPFMGVRVLLALGLAILFKWSKAATLVGVYLINPLTGPPFYVLAFTLGQFLLGADTAAVFADGWNATTLIASFWNNGAFLLALTVGGVLLALPVSLFLYWSAYRVVTYLQRAEFKSNDTPTPKTQSHEMPDHRRQWVHRNPPGLPTAGKRS